MLKVFRALSLIEGLSLLILLFLAMPAKYVFGYSEFVPVFGMAHGLLWAAYFVLSLLVNHQKHWSVGFWLTVLVASVIPFACFVLDKQLQQAEGQGLSAERLEIA